MNTLCTFYNPATGVITNSGSVSEETLQAYIDLGINVILNESLSPDTHYIVDHQPVAYTDVELADKAKVVAGWIWQMPERMAVDTRSLADVKLTKNAEINAARLAATRMSFTFNGKEISCDELSRSDIDGVNGIVSLNQAMPQNWVGGWKAIDNTYVSIPDVATWKLFYGAMVDKGQANFNHAQELKAALAAATTAEQVKAITWGA